MQTCSHCQSCGMPLEDVVSPGTEKDGSKSLVYCIHCYRDGKFTHPDMNLEDMRSHVLAMMPPGKMSDRQLSDYLQGLANLKRWLGRDKATNC